MEQEDNQYQQINIINDEDIEEINPNQKNNQSSKSKDKIQQGAHFKKNIQSGENSDQTTQNLAVNVPEKQNTYIQKQEIAQNNLNIDYSCNLLFQQILFQDFQDVNHYFKNYHNSNDKNDNNSNHQNDKNDQNLEESIQNAKLNVKIDKLNTESQIELLEAKKKEVIKEKEQKDLADIVYETQIRTGHDLNEKKQHEVGRLNKQHDELKKHVKQLPKCTQKIKKQGRHKKDENFYRFKKNLNLKKLPKWFKKVIKNENGEIIPSTNKMCSSQTDNTQYQIIKKAQQLVKEGRPSLSPEFMNDFNHQFPQEEHNHTTIKNYTYFQKHFVADKMSEQENQAIEMKTWLMLEVLTNSNFYSEFTNVQQKNSKDDSANNIHNSEMREHLYKLRLFEIIQKLKESDRKGLFYNWLPKRSITPDVFLQIPQFNNNNNNFGAYQEKFRIDYLIENTFY